VSRVPQPLVPLRSDLDVCEMSFVVVSYDSAEAIGIEFVLEFPKGIALKVLACSQLEESFVCG
jgi:hypothetical protein